MVWAEVPQRSRSLSRGLKEEKFGLAKRVGVGSLGCIQGLNISGQNFTHLKESGHQDENAVANIQEQQEGHTTGGGGRMLEPHHALQECFCP